MKISSGLMTSNTVIVKEFSSRDSILIPTLAYFNVTSFQPMRILLKSSSLHVQINEKNIVYTEFTFHIDGLNRVIATLLFIHGLCFQLTSMTE